MIRSTAEEYGSDQGAVRCVRRTQRSSVGVQTLPGLRGTIKSPEDQRKSYPELYRYILSGEPRKFQWKAWGSWAPTVTSVDYRAVTGEVADLADKHQWTQLLNAGLGDLLHSITASWPLGVEGGFGQTGADHDTKRL